MTDLSPATADIVKAFDDRYELLGGFDDNWQELCIAAALRAAAKELGPRRKLEPGYIFSAPAEQWHHEFRLESERKLLAIAAELEGAQ